jgi:hypothetical protein
MWAGVSEVLKRPRHYFVSVATADGGWEWAATFSFLFYIVFAKGLRIFVDLKRP